MNLRLWTAITIFVGSYLPLSLILLAQDFNYSYVQFDLCLKFWAENANCEMPFQHPLASLTIFVVSLFCFILTIIVLWLLPMKKGVTIVSAEYIPSELMNYTLPYVVSFMGIGYSDADKFVGIAIFLLWIFWITHKSGQVILNPVLVAFGWRLHKVTYRFEGSDKEHHTTAFLRGDASLNTLSNYNWIQDVMIVRKASLKGQK